MIFSLMKSKRKHGTHCLFGNEMNHTNFTKTFCKHWAVAATNSTLLPIFQLPKVRNIEVVSSFIRNRWCFLACLIWGFRIEECLTKQMGGDLREFALVGEGSWFEEFGETEVGTSVELRLISSELCVFPICGKYWHSLIRMWFYFNNNNCS